MSAPDRARLEYELCGARLDDIVLAPGERGRFEVRDARIIGRTSSRTVVVGAAVDDGHRLLNRVCVAIVLDNGRNPASIRLGPPAARELRDLLSLALQEHDREARR